MPAWRALGRTAARPAGRCWHDAGPAVMQYRSADGCLVCKLQQYFWCNRHGAVSDLARARPEPPRRMTSAVPESAHFGLLGKSMNMMVSASVLSGRACEDLMTR